MLAICAVVLGTASVPAAHALKIPPTSQADCDSPAAFLANYWVSNPGTPSQALYGGCLIYYDSGTMSLKPWHSVSTDQSHGNNYLILEWNHHTDTKTVTAVSISGKLESDLVSYTNWSFTTTHYARTTLLFTSSCGPTALPCPLPEETTDPVQNPFNVNVVTPVVVPGSAPQVSAVPNPRPGLGAPARQLVRAGTVGSVTSTCPPGEHRAGHNVSAGLLSNGSPLAARSAAQRLGEPKVSQLTRRGAVATVDARRLPKGTTASLNLSLVCGERNKVRRATSIDSRRNASVIIGSARDETLRAGSRGAVIYAGPGRKTLVGGPRPDRIHAGGGITTLRARSDDDVLFGGPGANRLLASPSKGARTMLVAGTGGNTLIGGPGLNYIDSRQGRGANVIRCKGRSIVMARKRDRLVGNCTRVAYSR